MAGQVSTPVRNRLVSILNDWTWQSENRGNIFPPLCVKFFLNSFFPPADPVEYSGHFQVSKSPVLSFIKLQTRL